MGVSIPSVAITIKHTLPYYGPRSTSVWTDEAVARFKNAPTAIAAPAETRLSVLRLARELQKTIRRVNALEKIRIPDYDETLKYVVDSLEVSDRAAFYIS